MKPGLKRTAVHPKRGGENRSFGFLMGAAGAASLLLLLSAAFAYLIGKGSVPIKSAPLIGKGCFAFSSLFGCIIAARKAKKRKLLCAASAGFVSLLAAALCLAAVGVTERMSVWLPILIVAIASIIAAVLSAKRKRYGYG